MSLLLDALQRASKEKEKLAESRTNPLGSSVSKASNERNEESSPLPSLSIEATEERQEFKSSAELSIEPMTTPEAPDSRSNLNIELAVSNARREGNEESAVTSLAIEESQPQISPSAATTELGPISPAVAEISQTLAVSAAAGGEKLRQPEIDVKESQRATATGQGGSASMERKTVDPAGRLTEGGAASRPNPMPSPQVARDILGATAKRLPNRRVIALGGTALSVAGIYLAFHLGAFNQFFGKSGSSLTPANPPPPVATLEQAPTPVSTPAIEQRAAEVDAKAKNVAGATGSDLDRSKVTPSLATSKTADDAGVAKPFAEKAESTKPVSREAKARQARPTLVASTTTTSALDTAYAAMSSGQLDIAADLYRRALAGNPAERDAFLGLAYIAQRKGNNEEAKNHFLQVLRIDPGNFAASSGLLSISAEGDLQQAASRAREMAERAPDSAVVMGALGGILAKEGRIAEAQQAYFRALTLEPENAFHAFNLAVALDKLHKNSQALGYYQRALASAEKMPVADRSGFPMKEARERAEQLRQSFLERQLPPPPDPQPR